MVEVQTRNSKVEMETVSKAATNFKMEISFKEETKFKVEMETSFKEETNFKVEMETANSKVEITHFQMEISFQVGMGTIRTMAVIIKRNLVETKGASMVRGTLREDSIMGLDKEIAGTMAQATTGKVGITKHRLTVSFTSG